MRLRAPSESEVPSLLDMMAEFNAIEGIEFRREPMAVALDKLLGDDRLGRVVLVDEDSTVAGYAVVTWGYDLEFAGRDCFLTEIYLIPRARARGLGKRVLSAIEDLAREAGASALHLGVRPENKHALALYRGAGYQAWTRLMFTKML